MKNVFVRGRVEVIARDPDGRITAIEDGHNLIPNAGVAAIPSRLNGDGAEPTFTHFAVGIGTVAANATDTTLLSEITDSGLAAASATVGRETDSIASDTATWDKTWSVTGTKAVTECGILNTDSTLLGRRVFAAINVESGYTLQMVYKVIIATA